MIVDETGSVPTRKASKVLKVNSGERTTAANTTTNLSGLSPTLSPVPEPNRTPIPVNTTTTIALVSIYAPVISNDTILSHFEEIGHQSTGWLTINDSRANCRR